MSECLVVCTAFSAASKSLSYSPLLSHSPLAALELLYPQMVASLAANSSPGVGKLGRNPYHRTQVQVGQLPEMVGAVSMVTWTRTDLLEREVVRLGGVHLLGLLGLHCTANPVNRASGGPYKRSPSGLEVLGLSVVREALGEWAKNGIMGWIPWFVCNLTKGL